MTRFEKLCETGSVWAVRFWYDRNDENNPYEILWFDELTEAEAMYSFNDTPIGSIPANGYELVQIQLYKSVSEDEEILVATKDESGTWYE